MYCTYHSLPQKFRTILLLAFDFPRHPEYTVSGTIGSVAIFHNCRKIEGLQLLGNGMKFQYHFIAEKNSEFWSVSKLSMSSCNHSCFNTEYISCTSEKYCHETHTNDFLKARISYQYFEKLSLFPASKFLCCWIGIYRAGISPNGFFSQIRRLSSVQSSARSIVWYVSSYSSTSGHGGIAFHAVTVVEDFSFTREFCWIFTWEVAMHPALNGLVQLYEEFLAVTKDFDKIKPMAWQLKLWPFWDASQTYENRELLKRASDLLRDQRVTLSNLAATFLMLKCPYLSPSVESCSSRAGNLRDTSQSPKIGTSRSTPMADLARESLDQHPARTTSNIHHFVGKSVFLVICITLYCMLLTGMRVDWWKKV